MRVLALDVSTKTGWALFSDGQLAESGELAPIKVANFNVQDRETNRRPEYPYNLIDASAKVAEAVEKELFLIHWPLDVVVVENTNKGKNRHTQRILEFIHHDLLTMMRRVKQPMVYMDTSEWRQLVGLEASKEDKKQNAKLSKAKRAAAATGTKLDKKALGIKGKITVKHRAVRMVNEKYGMKLKQKQNDQADAILMGLAYVTRSAK